MTVNVRPSASSSSGAPGAVPTSSGRNRRATYRALTIAAVVLAFLLVAIFVPW